MNLTEVFRSLERVAPSDSPEDGRLRDLDTAIAEALKNSRTDRRPSYPSVRIRTFCKRLLDNPAFPKGPRTALLLYERTSGVVLQQINRPVVKVFRSALERLAQLDPVQAQIILLHLVAGIVPLNIAEYTDRTLDSINTDIDTGKMFLEAEMAGAGYHLKDLDEVGIRSAGGVTVLLESKTPLRDIAVQRYDVLRRKARPVKRLYSHDPLYDTTEAVDEAIMRLLDKTEQRPRDEQEFLGLFIERLRHVVVDHGRIGKKRGQDVPHVPIQDELDASPKGLHLDPENAFRLSPKQEARERLSEAMQLLKQEHPDYAEVLSARYFESPHRNVEQLAESYNVAPATIKRWTAKAIEFLRMKVVPKSI